MITPMDSHTGCPYRGFGLFILPHSKGQVYGGRVGLWELHGPKSLACWVTISVTRGHAQRSESMLGSTPAKWSASGPLYWALLGTQRSDQVQ